MGCWKVSNLVFTRVLKLGKRSASIGDVSRQAAFWRSSFKISNCEVDGQETGRSKKPISNKVKSGSRRDAPRQVAYCQNG